MALSFISSLFLRKNFSFLIGSSFLGTTTLGSSYALYQNVDILSSTEHSYLSRVRLLAVESENTSTGLTLPEGRSTVTNKKIEGEIYDFGDPETLRRLVDETIVRLNAFYKKYSSEKTVVNFSIIELLDQYTGDITSNRSRNKLRLPNFFVHTQSHKEKKNLNNFWLDKVRLNQLSIDRYGYQYDNEGKAKNGDPKLVNLVSWADVGVKEMYLRKGDGLIEFNVFKDIPESELKILFNEDNTKYEVKEKKDEVNNDWFVWLDKDLLLVKLNYFLQTYIFNHEYGKKQKEIQKIIGFSYDEDEEKKEEEKSVSQESEQKQNARIIKKNFDALSPQAKEFAENYISEFLSEGFSKDNEDSWKDVVTHAINPDKFIKSSDLNRIYNKFQSKQKSLSVFENHLISTFKSGDIKSLEKYLNTKKPKDIKGIFAYRDWKKSENVIRVPVDRSINFYLSPSDLYNLLTKYSSRYFKFDIYKKEPTKGRKKRNAEETEVLYEKKRKLIFPRAIYSTMENEKDQAISVFHIKNENKYSF